MTKAPYTTFGETKNIPVKVYINSKYCPDVTEWDEEWWIERPEDWYGLMSSSAKNKRMRVIERSEWLKAK
jgi:hypothetical protein